MYTTGCLYPAAVNYTLYADNRTSGLQPRAAFKSGSSILLGQIALTVNSNDSWCYDPILYIQVGTHACLLMCYKLTSVINPLTPFFLHRPLIRNSFALHFVQSWLCWSLRGTYLLAVMAIRSQQISPRTGSMFGRMGHSVLKCVGALYKYAWQQIVLLAVTLWTTHAGCWEQRVPSHIVHCGCLCQRKPSPVYVSPGVKSSCTNY